MVEPLADDMVSDGVTAPDMQHPVPGLIAPRRSCRAFAPNVASPNEPSEATGAQRASFDARRWFCQLCEGERITILDMAKTLGRTRAAIYACSDDPCNTAKRPRPTISSLRGNAFPPFCMSSARISSFGISRQPLKKCAAESYLATSPRFMAGLLKQNSSLESPPAADQAVAYYLRCPATEGAFPIPPEGAPRARGLPVLRFHALRQS